MEVPSILLITFVYFACVSKWLTPAHSMAHSVHQSVPQDELSSVRIMTVLTNSWLSPGFVHTIHPPCRRRSSCRHGEVPRPPQTEESSQARIDCLKSMSKAAHYLWLCFAT